MRFRMLGEVSMKKYEVGIIGCGRIASLLEQEPHRDKPCTHAGCHDYCSRTTMVAAADADQNRLHAFGRRWKVSRLYPSWQEMLEKESLDIVSVCTYPVPHREIVSATAASGVKAIFCEKAMATSLREADEMIAACATHGVKLSINHTRRWDWRFRTVKSLIEQGRIGDLQAMTLNFSGGMTNGGTHYFDMLRFFAGDVAWAVGHLSGKELLDPGGSGYFYFHNNVRCHVNSVGGGRADSIFELIGNQGRITISSIRPGRFRLFVDDGNGIKEEPFPATPAEHRINTFSMGRCVIPLSVEEIVESLDSGTDTISTGFDGRAALEMIFSIHESERLGNRRVDFPLTNRDLQVLVRPANFVSDVVPKE